LHAAATVGAVIGDGDTPPPARIVLLSDGKETVPANPNSPRGAFTAARSPKDQDVPISTISFGTAYGTIDMNGSRVPVPVDTSTMKQVAQLSGGTAYTASNSRQLTDVYTTLQQQIGYESARFDASAAWLRMCALTLAVGALAALLINRRLPV
jgi:Ca-activated chloride channel family protein